MKKFVKISAAIAAGLPLVGFAEAVNPGYINSVIDSAQVILDRLVILLIALAIVWFIWNVIRFTMADDDEGKGKAKTQMIWGVIAIAVIVSVWGLVALLQTVSGVNRGTSANSFNIDGLTPKR